MKKSGMLRKSAVLVHKVQHFLYLKLNHVCHKSEHLFHSAYMGLVAYEAHGFYKYAAAGTFAVIIVSAFIGGGAETVAEVAEEASEL